MIYLKYSRTGTKEKNLTTATSNISIGTLASNTIQLDGPGILARHAEIEAQSLKMTATADAPLININGQQTQSQTLENGDIITLGEWTLRFFHTDEENYTREHETRTIKVATNQTTTAKG